MCLLTLSQSRLAASPSASLHSRWYLMGFRGAWLAGGGCSADAASPPPPGGTTPSAAAAAPTSPAAAAGAGSEPWLTPGPAAAPVASAAACFASCSCCTHTFCRLATVTSTGSNPVRSSSSTCSSAPVDASAAWAMPSLLTAPLLLARRPAAERRRPAAPLPPAPAEPSRPCSHVAS